MLQNNMYETISEMNSEVKHDVKMGNKELEVIMYTDDTVLLVIWL
jgi:hypothetical protein